MAGNSKQRLFVKIVLVASLLSPFAFFSSALIPWGNNNTAGWLAQEMIYPVEFAWRGTANFFVEGWNHYFALSGASKENENLKSELNMLGTKILDYEEQQAEVHRLRALLGFTERLEKKRIVAEVVGSAREEPFHTLRISKGEMDDVHVGMPVVTSAGVVGRVIRTGLKFSDVQLLIDSNFNLDVLLQRTRARGVLRGKGSYCLLKLNRRSEIRIGDTVITSGIVGGLPKGLPVGRVVRISYESDHISQTITVEPWVDHQRVDEVVVLQNSDKEINKIMETVGKAWLKKTVDGGTGG